MASRCAIVRDAVAAAGCGFCGSAPGRCPPGLSPAVCRLAAGANARLGLVAARLAVGARLDGGGAALRAMEADYGATIAGAEAALAAAYPRAPPGAAQIGWGDFDRCLASPGGGPGPDGRVWLGRPAALLAGFSPDPPLGGRLLQGRLLGPLGGPVPLGVEYLLNPDLAVFLFAALLCAALGLACAGWLRKKGGARALPGARGGPRALEPSG